MGFRQLYAKICTDKLRKLKEFGLPSTGAVQLLLAVSTCDCWELLSRLDFVCTVREIHNLGKMFSCNFCDTMEGRMWPPWSTFNPRFDQAIVCSLLAAERTDYYLIEPCIYGAKLRSVAQNEWKKYFLFYFRLKNKRVWVEKIRKNQKNSKNLNVAGNHPNI